MIHRTLTTYDGSIAIGSMRNHYITMSTCRTHLTVTLIWMTTSPESSDLWLMRLHGSR